MDNKSKEEFLDSVYRWEIYCGKRDLDSFKGRGRLEDLYPEGSVYNWLCGGRYESKSLAIERLNELMEKIKRIKVEGAVSEDTREAYTFRNCNEFEIRPVLRHELSVIPIVFRLNLMDFYANRNKNGVTKKKSSSFKKEVNPYCSNPFENNEDIDVEKLTGFSDKKIYYNSNKRKRNTHLDINRLTKYPSPNYEEFGKPEYIDTNGIEYRLAGGAIRSLLIDTGEISGSAKEFKHPQDNNISNEEIKYGNQVLWVRMPIKNRDNTPFPNPIGHGQKIRMYHIGSQIICEGFAEAVFVPDNRKTGYVFLRNFKSIGRPNDPSEYNNILEKNYKRKYI